jgi:hypothetical protein
MEIQQDFKELLTLFNDHNVQYLIVGGYALAFHGAPRYTGDIDIYVKPDIENAIQILQAPGNMNRIYISIFIVFFSTIVYKFSIDMVCDYRYLK